MCFQASRFDSRMGDDNTIILTGAPGPASMGPRPDPQGVLLS